MLDNEQSLFLLVHPAKCETNLQTKFSVGVNVRPRVLSHHKVDVCH